MLVRKITFHISYPKSVLTFHHCRSLAQRLASLPTTPSRYWAGPMGDMGSVVLAVEGINMCVVV
jgi:hypothetical protein